MILTTRISTQMEDDPPRQTVRNLFVQKSEDYEERQTDFELSGMNITGGTNHGDVASKRAFMFSPDLVNVSNPFVDNSANSALVLLTESANDKNYQSLRGSRNFLTREDKNEETIYYDQIIQKKK